MDIDIIPNNCESQYGPGENSFLYTSTKSAYK